MSGLRVDSTRCQGHGRCYSLYPELFECEDDDGHARVLVPEPAGGQATDAAAAVRECPERAITLD